MIHGYVNYGTTNVRCTSFAQKFRVYSDGGGGEGQYLRNVTVCCRVHARNVCLPFYGEIILIFVLLSVPIIILPAAGPVIPINTSDTCIRLMWFNPSFFFFYSFNTFCRG